MNNAETAIYFTATIIEELHSLESGWNFSNEAAIERAHRLKPGWHWLRGSAAGSRLILTFEPFAEPGEQVSLPWRKGFDRWFRIGG